VKQLLPALVAVCALAGAVTPIAAHPYLVVFSGTVDAADGNDTWGPLWGTVTTGDVWRLTMRVESDIADTDASATQGVYPGAVIEASLDIESVAFSTLVGPGMITVINDATDSYTVQVNLQDGADIYPIALTLSDSTGAVFGSDDLPFCDILDPNAFDSDLFSLTQSGGAGGVAGTVEPSDFFCDWDCNGNGQPDELDTILTPMIFCIPSCPPPCSNGSEYAASLTWAGQTYTELNCPAVPVAGSDEIVMIAALADCLGSVACPGIVAGSGPFQNLGCMLVEVPLPGSGLTLCVGPAGGPADCCSTPFNLACNYNPDLIAVAPSNRDCNGNRVDDGIDVALRTSRDDDGNGIPDECRVQPTLHVDVTVAQISGPVYPTDSILMDVQGVRLPPSLVIPVEILALSLQQAAQPNPISPVPMQMNATDDGGTGFFGGAAIVTIDWVTPPDDKFPDSVSYELLVELQPSGGNSPVGSNPPVDQVPSSTSFDVFFEIDVFPGGSSIRAAGLPILGTAGQTLHFEIGPGQPLEFANVVVGGFDRSFAHPAFPITFDLELRAGTQPDSNMPLVVMTMAGEFNESLPTDIPTMSQWGLVILCGMLFAAGTLIVRKRIGQSSA